VVNVLARVEFKTAWEIAKLATDLYADRKVDSVYIIFSEFKSVMAPNLTLEKLLPVKPSAKKKTRREARIREDSGSSGRLHLRAARSGIIEQIAAALHRDADFAGHAGIVGFGIRRADDGDGIGDQKRWGCH